MEELEDIKKPGPWGTSMKWGVIGGIVVVIVSYLASFNIDWTNVEEIENARGNWTQWFSYAVLAGIIIMAQMEHKNKELGGFMGYGRGVGVATVTGIISGLCMAIYMFIFFGILHPEFQQLIIESALSKMKDLPPGQEEEVMKWMKISTGPTAMALFTLIGNFFIGLIIGLITSIFTHKNQPA